MANLTLKIDRNSQQARDYGWPGFWLNSEVKYAEPGVLHIDKKGGTCTYSRIDHPQHATVRTLREGERKRWDHPEDPWPTSKKGNRYWSFSGGVLIMRERDDGKFTLSMGIGEGKTLEWTDSSSVYATAEEAQAAGLRRVKALQFWPWEPDAEANDAADEATIRQEELEREKHAATIRQEKLDFEKRRAAMQEEFEQKKPRGSSPKTKRARVAPIPEWMT